RSEAGNTGWTGALWAAPPPLRWCLAARPGGHTVDRPLWAEGEHMAHALIIDDDADVVEWLQEVARMEGFTVARAQSLRDARIELGRQRPDVLLTDLALPDGEGIELLRELEKPEVTEVIVITGHATVDSAASALQHEIGELRDELRRLGRFGRILGSSQRMQVLYDQLTRVAPTSATVMLIGES